MTSITVRFPQFYWLADPACFPNLTQDPDLADQLDKPRHQDKYSVNWAEVGAFVQDIGNRLNKGDYRVDPDDSDFVEVAVEFGNLSEAEIEIVRRWFQHGAAPHGDPTNLVDGRHRLWNCWSADKGLMLPVESSILCVTLEPADSPVHDLVPCEARDKLNVVTDAVREHSSAYVDRLIELSSGYAVDDRDGDTFSIATVTISPRVDEATDHGVLSVLKGWFEHFRSR